MSNITPFPNIQGPAGQPRNMPRTTRVKNKAPAPIQITAEQILREAAERLDSEFKPPKQKITDPDELEDYRYRKRKEFEDSLRRNRNQMGIWVRYAVWEESQKDLERARSLFERAIDVDYRNVNIWLKYAEMEMRNKNINAARNIWDRAVTLLPRVNQFWLKYSYMEDILGNFAGARMIFERWMEWEPETQAWLAYIRFELRCGEIERARNIYQRFVQVHQTSFAWLKWARFEEKQGQRQRAREVYESALSLLGEEANEKLYISFAKFEEKCKEFERARSIYKYALDNIPKKEAEELYKTWISFEKKYGDKSGIENVIIGKRRFQYEEELKLNPQNYDTWFDYIRLEEEYGDDLEKIRDIFERAIAQVPPAPEKRLWKRYIYFWINYALFEELEAQDMDRAREVYKECIKQIPHKKFSFSKIWVLYANFELRQKNIQKARSVYGHAIGLARKDKIFESYIQMELQLGNLTRCRAIYEKWLESAPHKCKAWIKFAQLEKTLREIDRARAIFEFGINQPTLDTPELLWKAYIDFEIDEEQYDQVRTLYRQLLERTNHVKVWISFAQFETSIGELQKARDVLSEANDSLKSEDDKEARALLLDTWKEFEDAHGDEATQKEIQSKLPQRVVKKRQLHGEDGTVVGMEEYVDYSFPGEEAPATLKILERARQWKKAKIGEAFSTDSNKNESQCILVSTFP